MKTDTLKLLLQKTVLVEEADRDQILRTVGIVTAISPLLSRPYGLYLDWARNKCGVTSYDT